MKFLRILFLVFLASCGPVYAQIQLGTNFQVNTALPIDTRMSVADLTARDAISALVRWEGLIAYVVSEGKHYALIGGIDNLDWQELGTGGGGGGTGDIPKWAPAQDYVAGVSTVWEELSLKIYVANTTHTSGATFAGDIANWDELSNPFSATNLSVTGNSLISTDLNGDIIIDPDGTGVVNIPYIGSNHVVYTGPSGNLRGEAAFSYNQSTNILRVDGVDIGGTSTITTHTGDQTLTLDASGAGIIDVNAPINLESVTANQVAFSDGISGNIVGSANFTYDSLVNSFTAGALNFIDGIISSTALNGNITISPDGTGEVDVTSALNIDSGVTISGSTIEGTNASADLVIAPAALRQIELTGDTEINNLFFPAAVGDGAYITTILNEDITIAPAGTGELSVLTPADIEQVRVQDNAVTTNVTDGNVTILTNGTGDATVTYGTNELSLNPTSGKDSLLKNPSFETGEIEYSCTDATGAIVASTIPSQNDERMFQMTVTSAGGFCDFIVTTGAKFQGLPFVIGGLFQTELLDVEYCTLVNGAESNCIPVDAIADDTTDPFNKAISTQDLSGATSNGLRIKTTSSTSGVINSSKIALDLGTLPTGQAIVCNGGLDCENEFSAYLTDGVGVATVSNLNYQGWVEDATQPSTGVYEIPVNGFTATPNCDAEADRGSTGISTVVCEYRQIQSTASLLRVECTNVNGTAVEIDRNFTLSCQKAAPDFKSTTERGVVILGDSVGDSDWQSYTPTTGLTGGTASIDGRWRKVGDSMEVKISASWSSIFTGGTPTFTLPTGYEIDLDKFPSGTASSSFTLLGRAFLEDSGAGSASSPYYADVLYSSTTGVIVKYAGNIASNAFPASLDPISTTLPFTWAANDSIYMTFTVPIEGWSSSKQVVGTFNGLSKISGEGNDRFEKGWVSARGASVNTDCNVSPCVMENAVGDVGRAITLESNGTGFYNFVSTGWKPNAPIRVHCIAESIGVSTDRKCLVRPSVLVADGSGNLTVSQLIQTRGSGGTLANSYVQVFAEGARQ